MAILFSICTVFFVFLSALLDVLYYCVFLYNRLVRGCKLGDLRQFPASPVSGPWSFFQPLSLQKDIAYSFHIEAYYMLCVSFCTKIKESINQMPSPKEPYIAREPLVPNRCFYSINSTIEYKSARIYGYKTGIYVFHQIVKM